MGSQPCPCAHSLLQAPCEGLSGDKVGICGPEAANSAIAPLSAPAPWRGKKPPQGTGSHLLWLIWDSDTRNSAVPAQGQHKRRSRRTSSSVLGCPSPSDTATKSVPCKKNRLHSGLSWGGGCQSCRRLQGQCLLRLRGGERSRTPLAQGGSRGLGGGGGAWAPVSGLYHTGQPRAGWPLIINPGPGP